MSSRIKKCPSCKHDLSISVLRCPDCGLELRGNFEESPFDKLSDEQTDFLMSFLKNRGNLKNLQAELQISYPYAKKRLDELLSTLGIVENNQIQNEQEVIDLKNITVDKNSTQASEIIKAKLMDEGGHAVVRLQQGKLREITAAPNGTEFLCPQLVPYKYTIFDAIVELLLNSPGYRAKKGYVRGNRLGDPGCEETTGGGAILKYLGKKPGETGYDPGFVLYAVLEWADIIENGRGEISLKPSYLRRLADAGKI